MTSHIVKNTLDTRTTGNSTGSDSIDEIVLQSLPVKDRLSSMLFLAALVHGIVILGVNFTPVNSETFQEAISLEVTIVVDPEPNVLVPDRASYLAQANQEGASNTRKQSRPTARPDSLVPVNNPGRDKGDRLKNSTTANDAGDKILTAHSMQGLSDKDKRHDDLSPDIRTAAFLESGDQLTMPLPQDIVTIRAIRGVDNRELIASVDTEESSVAGYLQRWKTKIETIGIRYLPKELAIEDITGNPTLEVTISASGQLHNVFVRHSSGSRTLDEVALDILRQAAPFDPFPMSIRADYDQLRFAYKWQFKHLPLRTVSHNKQN